MEEVDGLSVMELCQHVPVHFLHISLSNVVSVGTEC